MAFIDLDEFTEPLSDAIEAIGDAGDLVGGILKTVSPLLGTVPGVGTALAVAVYAAGALAAKDTLTDALLGTVSAAMPPGVPRVAFDGALSMAKDIADGRSVMHSAIAACRQTAEKAGGAPAAAAFEAGSAFINGERIDQRALAHARAFALSSGGQAAAASFDAAIAIAESKGADQAIIDVARGYINDAGGTGALSAFDTGVALAYGKTLQQAGYAALQTFVRGNNGVEKIVNFVEKVGRAKSLGQGLQEALESDLASEFFFAAGANLDASFIDETLKPHLDAIRADMALLEVPAGELAQRFAVDEAIVREAQALLRGGDGSIDETMLANLKNHRVEPLLFDISERNVAQNDGFAEKGRAIIARGAKWRGRLLSDIRAASTFAITVDALEGMSPVVVVRRRETYEIDDEWRRGFDIAIGACEGLKHSGHAQNLIETSLTSHAAKGFHAGCEVQINRSNPFGLLLKQSAQANQRLARLTPQSLKDVRAVRPVGALTFAARPSAPRSARKEFISAKPSMAHVLDAERKPV